MIISAEKLPKWFLKDKTLRNAYTFEEKQKTIFYGMGWEDGIAEGREDGRKEERIEIAKAMLSQNCDISLISEVTSLPIEKIERLKEA